MVYTYSLRIMLGGCSLQMKKMLDSVDRVLSNILVYPNQSISKVISQRSVDSMTNMFNSRTISNNKTVAKIRVFSSLFCINTHQIQFSPNNFNKVIQIEIVFTRNNNCIRLMCQSINFFQTDLINLVVTL